MVKCALGIKTATAGNKPGKLWVPTDSNMVLSVDVAAATIPYVEATRLQL
jgi:hypothetical protein